MTFNISLVQKQFCMIFNEQFVDYNFHYIL